MTLIVAVSDIHADHRNNGVERFEEIARGMRQAVQVAIDRKADLFVGGGDYSDPDSGAIVFRVIALLIESMMRLDKAGIPQVWVKGNHDATSGSGGESVLTPIARLSDYCYARVAESPMTIDWWTERSGRRFGVLLLPHGQYDAAARVSDFATSMRVQDASVGPPGVSPLRVVVSHLFPIPEMEPGEETSEMPRGGPNPLPLEALAEIPGEVLVLSGHYHKRQVFRSGVRGCPPVHVIGSLCQLSHSEESNSPGFLVIEV